MAMIEVKGYVNKPATKGNDRKFATFTLAERQMDRNKNPVKVFYNVTDFNTSEPPAESSFVTIKGYLNVRSYETDKGKGMSLDITAKEIEVAPPREGTNKAPAPAENESNWDF